MIKIIDNFLEKDLIEYLEKIFVSETPHYYCQSSTEKSYLFYKSNLNIQDYLIRFLIVKLQKNFSFHQILRAYLNIQFNKMDGHWHQDDGKNTILLMITKTLKKGSGQLQIKDENNVIKKIDFIQNRIIFFDASKLHRGLSPNEINSPRITLAFKTI